MSNAAGETRRMQQESRASVAVLTGGSGGIGRIIASRLLGAGYEVIVLGRRPPRPAAAGLRHIACDLTDPASVEAAVRDVSAFTSTVDVLIHCAGAISPCAVSELDAALLESQVAVNLTAPILLTSRLLPVMRTGGRIVFVNSLAAVFPLPGSSVYAATKAGLRNFALALAVEMKPRRITVSSVFPGAVNTGMLRNEMDHGGSVLNFVSAPADPQQIADLVMKAAARPGQEWFTPVCDGVFGRLCMMFPPLQRLFLPLLTYLGRRGMKRFRRTSS
ncbi:SDR family NAD(P)-dependent oxidoreductase [Acetobacter estunensis]|nr:SDR family oxidoreductase [Acetobacter estunensis]